MPWNWQCESKACDFPHMKTRVSPMRARQERRTGTAASPPLWRVAAPEASPWRPRRRQTGQGGRRDILPASGVVEERWRQELHSRGRGCRAAASTPAGCALRAALAEFDAALSLAPRRMKTPEEARRSAGAAIMRPGHNASSPRLGQFRRAYVDPGGVVGRGGKPLHQLAACLQLRGASGSPRWWG